MKKRFFTVVILVALVFTALQAPALAHPSCDDVEALEQWSDDRADHATDLLDSRRHVSEAFQTLIITAAVLSECSNEIIEAHTRAGMEGGNTDEAGLRKTWVTTNYTLIAGEYNRAAEAAAVLHHIADCRAMIVHESAAFAKFMTVAQSGLKLDKELKKCNGGGQHWRD